MNASYYKLSNAILTKALLYSFLYRGYLNKGWEALAFKVVVLNKTKVM